MNTVHVSILIVGLALGSIALFACGPKADQRIDLTRQILDGARIGSHFGDVAIAARYRQIIAALDSGLIDLETFEDRRARLDRAEDALNVFRKVIGLLAASIAAKDTDLIPAVISVIDSALTLVESLTDAGLAVPSELADFVEFIRFLKGDR